MNTYSKTIYVEVTAATEEGAEEEIGDLFGWLVGLDNPWLIHVDLEGPIEEV